MYLSELFLSLKFLKRIVEILNESKVKEECKIPKISRRYRAEKNPCTKKPLNFIFSQKTLEFLKNPCTKSWNFSRRFAPIF